MRKRFIYPKLWAVEKVRPTFVIDAWTLRDLIRNLTPDEDEEMKFGTGPKIGNLRVISRICHVKTERRSPVFVRASAQAAGDVLIGIIEQGNEVHLYAHSHPGHGPGATRPSGIDKRCLGKFQRAGSDAIGLIVVRCGCIRFFSPIKKFRVFITGAGVTQLDEYVYHIALF